MATNLALTTIVVEVKNKVAYDTPKVSRVMPKKELGQYLPRFLSYSKKTNFGAELGSLKR